MLAKDLVLFAAGNMVELLDLATEQQTCLRSLGGGGVGAIAVSRGVCAGLRGTAQHG